MVTVLCVEMLLFCVSRCYCFVCQVLLFCVSMCYCFVARGYCFVLQCVNALWQGVTVLCFNVLLLCGKLLLFCVSMCYCFVLQCVTVVTVLYVKVILLCGKVLLFCVSMCYCCYCFVGQGDTLVFQSSYCFI